MIRHFVELLVALHVVEVGLVRIDVGCNCCRMRLTYVGGYLQLFAAEFLPCSANSKHLRK